jgi:nucleotide-binding universal stress UspA family protein
MARLVEAEGIPCRKVVAHGFASDAVEGEIKASHADRLIMASHGRGKWGQFLIGSVAIQILDAVEIPVFVVGPHTTHCAEHAQPRRILHPVSMSGNYRQGVREAIELADSFDAQLTLLHVPDRDVEASIHPGCTLTWAENLFQTLVPEASKTAHAPKIEVRIAFGNLVDEIRKEAARTSSDWIVLGME